MISAIAIADPAPGTPGNSGNQNPHGAPPGQGGSAPGSSGTSNPHGTPPGQRITAPDAAGPSDSRPGGAPGPTSSPRTGTSLGPLGNMACSACDYGKAKGREEFLAACRFLAGVKGWEPTWELMAESLPVVHLHVVTEEMRGSERYVHRVEWRKDGLRSQGVEQLSWGDRHEWWTQSLEHWSRWGNGSWARNAVGPSRRLEDFRASQDSLISSVWSITPVWHKHRPSGVTEVRFQRAEGRGRMDWEVEQGSRLLVRIRARDAMDRFEWEETRRFEYRLGRSLLAERRRSMATGDLLVERLEWEADPGGIVLSPGQEPR